MIAELQGISGASMEPGDTQARSTRSAQMRNAIGTQSMQLTSQASGRVLLRQFRVPRHGTRRCASRYQMRARVPRRLQFPRPDRKAIALRKPEPTLELNGEGQSGKKQNDENDASKRGLVDATKHDDAEYCSRCQGRQTDGKVDQELRRQAVARIKVSAKICIAAMNG
jgi:hypothetical protein